ncbi:hypothetical protein [Couchioplanes caeruleus]|uniref:hypothetical protein n=1 Tax=Couchioplanes caeruleus TaxID=56438 RepID=UPI000A94A078|nr:hypothetical protein [Couchioplanes caeruleus]
MTLVFGGVVRSVADLTAGNPALTRIFERMGGASAATDSFLAGTSALMGLIAAAYAVQVTLRLSDEESAGHAEPGGFAVRLGEDWCWSPGPGGCAGSAATRSSRWPARPSS